MSKKPTYSIEVKCTNCEHLGNIEIPKGETADGVHECPSCGCETAHRKRDTVTYPTVPVMPPRTIPVPYPVPYPYPVPTPPVNPYPSPWRRWNEPIWVSEPTRTWCATNTFGALGSNARLITANGSG